MTTRYIFIFIFIFFVMKVESESESMSSIDSCSGRWIHIRRLPSRFNLDLLANCSEYEPIDLCPFLPNHGLGPKTHNHSLSWYRTDPLMLELFFHRRILEYPCLTSDPRYADAVFLPYYASIDSLRFLYGPDLNSSFDHGRDLYDFLVHDSPQVWARYSGVDHFLVVAGPAWDFSQPLTNDPPIWGTSFLELPHLVNVTALMFESRAWPWQEQAIPYPTSFHPNTLALFHSWLRRVRRSRRTSLALFAGGGGSSAMPNIRRSIRLECQNTTTTTTTTTNRNNNNNENTILKSSTSYSKLCEFVDCSNGVCDHDPIRYTRPMLQSTFCLQPPGDTPTRRSTFDGIIAGCIPVFFDEQSAKLQYGWHMGEDEYRDFSVFINKEEVVFKGLKIMDVLKSIPRNEIRKMREKVLEIMPRIMYRKHGSSLGLRTVKDAFDIAIEGALHRIKSTLNSTASLI